MKIVGSIVFALMLLSCNNGSNNQRVISGSSGNINNLTVVVDNLLWEQNVGEAIRNIIAAPAEGLPQDEPLFSIAQLPPQVFSDFTTKSRIILKIETKKEAATRIANDVYARPQTVVVVSGQNSTEIIDQLKTNAEKIIDAYQKEEIKEKQRRIKLSLFDITPIKNKLGLSIKFPTAYRVAQEEDNFFWIRKDITTGTMDLLMYEIPISALKKGDSTVLDVVRVRDSIGKIYIQGALEGSYLGTEDAYAPYFFETIIDNKPTFETKGIWDLKNAFMSGPFINYAIEDKVNNRYVMIEGYVFAPSVQKRDYMFELEAIIRSATLK
ncbi:DUF4837 domain-containing protein [Flavobacteriales bacterium 33_180_T64]|nr:DUF4837 domain-containing protein [Flavobacteriales bacterium 33_180_T64]